MLSSRVLRKSGRITMQNPYIDDNDNQPAGTNQPPQMGTATHPYYEYGSAQQQPTEPQNYHTAPGQFQPEPVPPARPGSGGRSGLRTGAIIALALVLALVFGTGIFAGWQFGRTSNAGNSGNVATLQPGNTSNVTVPQLNDNNIEAVREAVIAKVRPAVVQVNV